jgi:hypothetical protein
MSERPAYLFPPRSRGGACHGGLDVGEFPVASLQDVVVSILDAVDLDFFVKELVF